MRRVSLGDDALAPADASLLFDGRMFLCTRDAGVTEAELVASMRIDLVLDLRGMASGDLPLPSVGCEVWAIELCGPDGAVIIADLPAFWAMRSGFRTAQIRVVSHNGLETSVLAEAMIALPDSLTFGTSRCYWKAATLLRRELRSIRDFPRGARFEARIARQAASYPQPSARDVAAVGRRR